MKRIALAASLLLVAAAVAGVARPEGARAVDGTAATASDSITVAGNGSVIARPDDRVVLVRGRRPRGERQGCARGERAGDAAGDRCRQGGRRP